MLEGTLDISKRMGDVPRVPAPAGEALEIEQATVLNLLFEIDCADSEGLVPPAVQPTIPPVLSMFVFTCEASAVGPFRLAQAQIGCRAGVRPRGFGLTTVVDSPEAARALTDGWGFACKSGRIRVRKYYDRVDVEVRQGDESVVLEGSLLRPSPIAGATISYAPILQIAEVSHEGMTEPLLVQVDSDVDFVSAQRGRPMAQQFDAAFWGESTARLGLPISASLSTARWVFNPVAYLLRPAVPLAGGTISLR